ncbi:MAG: ABC transporter substrate-binding protein [Aphanocapsa sp. GSE-SYN-MK-11-07L]|jgi:NitT/TauT family transport system substrate-binding protein|nr:ABC transporter substrate-binding protein [Aphanocapsa sp. GSE-SYN-MK-11-07L]
MIKKFQASAVAKVAYGLLFLLCLLLPIACSQQSIGKPITVAISPWPGYASQWVAMEKGMFKDEGLEVKELFFNTQTESDDTFVTGKADLNWVGMPNTVPQISRDSSIKVIFQCDYSNGADGILGRNIKTAADLKGKKVAREDILFEEIMLRKYLEKLGLPRNQVSVLNMSAADSAAAFAAGKVDLAVTFEPWLTKAAKEGKGEIVFSTKDTNLIADVVTARAEFIENNKDALVAYIRALDKAIKLIKEKPDETAPIIAKKLGVKPEEVADQLAGVKLYDLEMNQTISFNPANPMNLYDSLEFAARIAKETKLIPQMIDVQSGLDESLIKSF